MDIFTVFITKIHNEQEYKHMVLVDCDTDCYGKKEHNHVAFHKYQWQRIKAQMKYLETEGMDESSLQYYESLSETEYHKRFERTLSEYTDEEIAEEVNKRASSIFPKLKFEVKVVASNGKN